MGLSGSLINAWYNEDRQLHKTDGPAVEYRDGSKFWFLNGLRHRTDGPAVILASGSVQFWAHNIKYESLEELSIGVIING